MTSYMETADMEKYHAQRQSASARSRFPAAVLALLVALLVGGTPHPAAAQFDSGRTGANGAFPPVPENGIPADGLFIIWNVKTGLVRYCSVYSLTGTVSEQCDAGSTTATAQIPGIPQGGVTNGVYHFTSFTLNHINGSRWLVPVGYSPNVPLTILSQGDITIFGGGNQGVHIMLRGWDGKQQASSVAGFSTVGGRGGPGAFDGGASGNGGSTPSSGNAGFGPSGAAGGLVTGSPLAQLYGASASASPLNPSLTPLSGGSGGGGGAGVAGGYQRVRAHRDRVRRRIRRRRRWRAASRGNGQVTLTGGASYRRRAGRADSIRTRVVDCRVVAAPGEPCGSWLASLPAPATSGSAAGSVATALRGRREVSFGSRRR